jgi:hypothetical protein
MLTLGWSDGNTFLPVNFNLLSSPKDEHVLCLYFASPKSSKLQRKIPTPTWGNLASGG